MTLSKRQVFIAALSLRVDPKEWRDVITGDSLSMGHTDIAN